MIQCPFCFATHVANTIFCNECGHCLLQDEDSETSPLEMSEIGPLDIALDGFEVAEPTPTASWPLLVRLRSASTNREIEIRLSKAICLGRVDPASNTFPEIDLTEEGNPSKSVSRRHARIFKLDNVVVVEDLGSINGTFINGRRLVPYLPENLNNGDTLQLGKLLLGVTIRRQ